MARHAFTVDEANGLIPWLEEVFGRLDELRERWRRHYEGTQILEAMWGEEVTAPNNPDHPELLDHRRGLESASRAVDAVVKTDILGRGLRFPAGGAENGIVDFPSTFEGRWVYLCWQRGEPKISFWHELDGGFAGRQEITAAQVLGMGMSGELPDDSALDF